MMKILQAIADFFESFMIAAWDKGALLRDILAESEEKHNVGEDKQNGI